MNSQGHIVIGIDARRAGTEMARSRKGMGGFPQRPPKVDETARAAGNRRLAADDGIIKDVPLAPWDMFGPGDSLCGVAGEPAV